MTLIELTQNVDTSRGGVHHDPASVSLTALEERIIALQEYQTPYDLASALAAPDPRCGCSADNEGSRCDWDDLGVLEHAYATRMAAAA